MTLTQIYVTMAAEALEHSRVFLAAAMSFGEVNEFGIQRVLELQERIQILQEEFRGVFPFLPEKDLQ